MIAVTKAVLPVAGLATRFLPATKAMPKVMLPVMDKPLIQYAVEEALDSGIEEIVFVASPGAGIIADHFARNQQLEQALASRGRQAELATVTRSNLEPGRVTTIYQDEPRGLGHAVWCARHVLADGPFGVILADELILGDQPQLGALTEVHATTGGNVVGVTDVEPAATGSYGILDVAERSGQVVTARNVVEKPAPEDAPSTLALVGRYVLDPAVLDELDLQRTGYGGEIQLTDAIARTLPDIPLHGWVLDGARYDCGSKLGFLEATIALALQHPEMAEGAAALLRRYAGDLRDGASGH